MRAPIPALRVGDEQCEVLRRLSASQTAAYREVQRARALLMARAGETNTRIAAELGASPATGTAWRERSAGGTHAGCRCPYGLRDSRVSAMR